MMQSKHCKEGRKLKTKIAELRKVNKISQEELALAVGVTRQTITSIEVEKYVASLPLAYKIAHYFNMSIEDVFDFSQVNDYVLPSIL
jgi:putative transcriptional regulator